MIQLIEAGLLRATSHARGNPDSFVVSPDGLDYYEQMHAGDSEPLREVDKRLQSYVEAPEFRAACPNAYARWKDAADLLWRADSEANLTTIGHKAREAMQEFATALVERHRPADVSPDPTKTLDRLSAVLRMRHAALGRRRVALLDALFQYWRAAVDIVQRQEHGGQKEREPLTWEDARRVVFQTASVMVEAYRAIDDVASQAPAQETGISDTNH